MILLAVGLLISLLLPALARARQRAQRISCISHLKIIGLGYRLWANDHEENFPWQVHQQQGGNVPDDGVMGSDFGELVNAFRCLSNELTLAKVLVCPADSQRRSTGRFAPLSKKLVDGGFAALQTKNLSYLAGWEASESLAQSILIGDGFLGSGLPPGPGNAGRSGVVKSIGARLGTDPPSLSQSNVSWTAGWHPDGANLGLADGSAHQLGAAQWPHFLATSADLQTNRTYRLVMPNW